MSKNYDQVWRLIESLDDISTELSDLLTVKKTALPGRISKQLLNTKNLP